MGAWAMCYYFVFLFSLLFTANAAKVHPKVCESGRFNIFSRQPEDSCSNCNEYETCKDDKCVCPQTGATPCTWVKCKEKDCYPGSCTTSGGSTCQCHGGFEGDNCKTGIDGVEKDFAVVVTELNVTLKFFDGSNVTTHRKWKDGISSGRLTLYANLQGKQGRQIQIDFIQNLKYPLPVSDGRWTLNYDTSVSVFLTGTSVKEPIRNCKKGQHVHCEVAQNFSGASKLEIQPEARLQFDTHQLKTGKGIMTVNIQADSSPPTYTSKTSSLFFCRSITKNSSLTVYWSPWNDAKSKSLTYHWEFRNVTSKNTTLEEGHKIDSGNWEPGDPYPVYNATKTGVYMAKLQVADEAGNRGKLVRTWILYDVQESRISTTDKPIHVKDISTHQQWITALKGTDGGDDITLAWPGRFTLSVHPDASKRVISKTGAEDNVPKLWQLQSPNEALKYQYAWFKGERQQTPTGSQWKNATSSEAKVTAARDNGDTFTMWIKAGDSYENNLTDSQVFYVDSTGPMIVDAAKPEFHWNTNHRIKGVRHYTSSITLETYDRESGIDHINVAQTSGNSVVNIRATATSLPREECKSQEGCFCSLSGRCQLQLVEALVNNCDFRGKESAKYVLDLSVVNEAQIATNIKTTLTIEFNKTAVDGLGRVKYAAPQDLTWSTLNETASRVQWEFITPCFERTGLEAYYFVNQKRNDMTVTNETTSIDINHLSKNDKVEFFIQAIYGDEKSVMLSQTFKHDSGLTDGAIAGIVVGLLAVVGLAIGFIFGRKHYQRYKIASRQKRRLPTPPANRFSAGSRPPLPLPAANPANGSSGREANGVPRRNPPPPPVVHDNDDEIEVYGSVDVAETLRSLTPQQYTFGDHLGSGKLAIVKQANLNDSGKQTVAAKMAKNNDNDRQKIILRAKLNYMATEISDHPNVVNLVAADLAEPILFLELCEDGPLSDWVKEHDVTPDVKEKLLLFSLDIASGLKHLHSINVVHKRLGIRNVLLSTLPERQIARLIGFGPLESELNSSKEDTRVPVRWMPPESLGLEENKPRVYNKATDMWSYGITVWEIFSKALMPFKGIGGALVKEKIKNGEKLAKPPDCPQKLFDEVVHPCWEIKPEKRPNVEKVCDSLKKLTAGKKKPPPPVANTIEMDVYENPNPSYQPDDPDDLYVNTSAMQQHQQPMYLDMCD